MYGGAVTGALYPVYGMSSVFFLLGSIFIDIDHYIDFLYYGRFRDWSVKNMFKFHGLVAKRKDYPHIYALEAFHTAEFLLTLLALGIYFHSAELVLLFAGMVFHLALDVYRLNQWGKVHVRAFSFVEYWYLRRKMRATTGDPEIFFDDVYAEISRKKS